MQKLAENEVFGHYIVLCRFEWPAIAYLASDSNQDAAFCNQGFGNSHNACITSRVKQKRSQKQSKSCFWPFDIADHASGNPFLCTRKLVKLKSLGTC